MTRAGSRDYRGQMTMPAPNRAPDRHVILAELVDALPEGVVAVEAAALEKYRYDWARVPGSGTPWAAVRAEDAQQVQVAVRWAARHGIPIVPRGAGSGVSGGASALDGGIVLSLERMADVSMTRRVELPSWSPVLSTSR